MEFAIPAAKGINCEGELKSLSGWRPLYLIVISTVAIRMGRRKTPIDPTVNEMNRCQELCFFSCAQLEAHVE